MPSMPLLSHIWDGCTMAGYLAHTLFSEVTRTYLCVQRASMYLWPGADRMLQLCLAYTQMEPPLIREKKYTHSTGVVQSFAWLR